MNRLGSSKRKFATLYHSRKFIIDLQVCIYTIDILSYRFKKFK